MKIPTPSIKASRTAPTAADLAAADGPPGEEMGAKNFNKKINKKTFTLR